MAMLPSFQLTPDDGRYPPLLRALPRPPSRLYCLGDVSALAVPSVTLVGSRRMTAYGAAAVDLLVPGVVRAGLAVVSGLAYGVDAASHRAVLAKGGRCVAVLGGGLDRIYPAEHAGLAQEIGKRGGCLLSEFPPGTPSRREHFPQRNRIVAGLSKLTVIIEAGVRSGTLITARHALEAGREVGVVPADVTRTGSAGTHELLRQGARPIICAEDVLELYGKSADAVIADRLRPALTGSMATLYDLISQGVGQTGCLLERSGLAAAELHSVLSVLELDGYIHYQGNEWQRT